MVNSDLVDWINLMKKEGYSTTYLIEVLRKQGYLPQEILDSVPFMNQTPQATEGLSPKPVLVLISSFVGSSAICFVVMLIGLMVNFWFAKSFEEYIIWSLCGLFFGGYLFFLVNDAFSIKWFSLVLSILAPIPAVLAIIGVPKFVVLYSKYISLTSVFSSEGLRESRLGFLQVFTFQADPIISAIIFYFLCVLCTFVLFFIKKQYTILWWYLFVPLLFSLTWVLVNTILSLLISPF